MIKTPKDLQSVRKEIQAFYEKEVRVHVDLGRNKSADFTGTLSGVYPALFTVRPHDENYRGKTAWSYAEVLCGTVKLRERKPQPAENAAK